MTGAGTTSGAPPDWRLLAPGLALIALTLLLFRETALAMVVIWSRSGTFTHAFLVPPIVIWLVWRRRDRLAELPVRPAPWLALPMLALCLLWLLGELAAVNAATQLALVSLVALSVPAVFGLAIGRELAFPLLFLFFSVPIGEFMVPPMMEWTADFTVAALQLSGVPVYREGLQFVIPSGQWSVVDACSGVRYLLASFMVGTLFAYLNFRSPARRAAMMAVSLLVPIIANWLRAYMIVMLGHLSGNQLAAGADHLIYGWVFFGIVVGAIFMVGARWSEAEAPPPAVPGSLRSARRGADAWAVALLCAGLLALTQVGAEVLTRPRVGPAPALSLPESLAGGWGAATAGLPGGHVAWTPAFANPSASAHKGYVAGDTKVSVWIGFYRDQSADRKLVTSTNGLVESGNASDWAQAAVGSTQIETDAGATRVRTAVLRHRAGGVDNQAATRLRVWYVYWIGGRLVYGDAMAKVAQAVNRVLGRGDDGAVVVLYTALEGSHDTASADVQLGRFAAQGLPALLRVLDAATDGR